MARGRPADQGCAGMSKRGWQGEQRMTGTWPAGKTPVPIVPGVHLPFTAPLLSGARGRLRDRSIDYILPNPSGGRGAYVALWSMVSDFATPTLHDTILAGRLVALPSLTPPLVRAAARIVAAEGYAGRAAAVAAVRAKAALDTEALRLWASLLMALIRRSDIPAHEQSLVPTGSAGLVPSQATDGFPVLAQRLGWDPVMLSAALEQLSTAFVPIAPGIGDAGGGRIRRLLALLQGLRTSLREEQAHHTMQQSACLTMILNRLGQCLDQAGTILVSAAAALADPSALLDRWQKSPSAAVAPMSLLEAGLDGWDRIGLLWLDARTVSARIGLIDEFGRLVPLAGSSPVIDSEGMPTTERIPAVRPRPVAGHSDPSRSNPLPAGSIERNERIRCDELALDDVHG
ncbi:hypothetical protein HN018_20605 [Lichenicola cladoniae]|uniref:Uncharacterized protein n=1 Tax=Lichenicola cladoniae TaxID=1484109 RepID=A0A6M8HV47_9PROT|nr:hypothetical protein [Lichenicola cladoniae]NPD69521.1 hypothetical protein [Acetobacteraceae bacterium]QKE92116.1 hypothetical protein HN018_20605 [Lichenicola cladoniae]